MIVVDTNVIAYLFIVGTHTVKAKKVLRKDPDWVAPVLWQSEFRNVLAKYLHKDQMSAAQALGFMSKAETLMEGREHHVPSARVLELTSDSGCSAYDCEFVALAEELGLSLVTADSKLVKSFPGIAVTLRDFAAG